MTIVFYELLLSMLQILIMWRWKDLMDEDAEETSPKKFFYKLAYFQKE